MSVSGRCNYNKAVLTYKALNKLTPSYISDLLKPVSETSTRQLRSSENGSLAVPRSRTALYDKSLHIQRQNYGTFYHVPLNQLRP